jgi:hypothetical protein
VFVFYVKIVSFSVCLDETGKKKLDFVSKLLYFVVDRFFLLLLEQSKGQIVALCPIARLINPGFQPCYKVVLFAPPKDEALFKQWEQNIPRKDENLKASSRVRSGHFAEDDIIKGQLLKGKDGK